MKNLTCGRSFILYNNDDDVIQSWKIIQDAENRDTYLPNERIVEDQRGDTLIQMIEKKENGDDMFIAFNQERQVFKTFLSNGSGDLMTKVREIQFVGQPDMIGLHARSDLISFAFHPKWLQEDTKHFIMTIDYSMVHTPEMTGNLNEDRMRALRERLAINQSTIGLESFMNKRDIIFKEALRCTRVKIEEISPDKQDRRPFQKRISPEKLRNKKVIFIQQGNNFFCHFVDLNGQVQMIKITDAEFERIHCIDNEVQPEEPDQLLNLHFNQQSHEVEMQLDARNKLQSLKDDMREKRDRDVALLARVRIDHEAKKLEHTALLDTHQLKRANIEM